MNGYNVCIMAIQEAESEVLAATENSFLWTHVCLNKITTPVY